MLKHWKLRKDIEGVTPTTPLSPQMSFELAKDLDISPLLLHILQMRGFVTKDAIHVFLSPNVRLLAPPEQWPGMPQAAEVLVTALVEGKKFAVWGDYDVDGVTSTALVLEVLEAHGYSPCSYIPDRTEGYGLNISALEKLAAEGVELLLTVDCGISDVEAVTRAKELGMTVVISDHHLPPDTLPPAVAVCNPRLASCPCPELAGVGVAFFLMCAVNTLLTVHTGIRYDMRKVLDFVALGTVADVVRLYGQNRILVKNGLLTMGSTPRPGVAALKSVCGLDMAAKLSAGQVGFALAPRINAAGRMKSAHMALELLRASNVDEALMHAKMLDNLNTERRKEEERIHEEAREQARMYEDSAGFVLYGKDWHPGIIGIVASRIVEEFYKPTLVLCDDDTGLKGSGRSIKEFHLHAGLTNMADVFRSYGGHALAAGVRLDALRLEELRTRFNTLVRQTLGNISPRPQIILDAELDFSVASDATFLHELELLQPFGVGNAEPVFMSPPLLVKNQRAFGYAKNHLLLDVLDESTGITLQGKAWRKATEFPPHMRGKYIRLAYTPGINAYNGVASVEVRIKDWKIEE